MWSSIPRRQTSGRLPSNMSLFIFMSKTSGVAVTVGLSKQEDYSIISSVFL